MPYINDPIYIPNGNGLTPTAKKEAIINMTEGITIGLRYVFPNQEGK